MPAPLDQDATAYLKQQGIPITTQSLNHTMQLLGQQPDLRPSYAGQGSMDVDVETMRPTNTPIVGKPLAPLKQGGGDFKSAFAAARKAQGAGGKFDWNGKSYNTNYKEEVAGKQTPAQIDKFGNGDEAEIKHNAEEEMQEDLLMERSGADEIDRRKEAENKKGQMNYRGAPNQVPSEDDGMNNLLAALLGGGAVAAGAGAVGYRGMKTDKARQKMSPDDLDPASSDAKGAMTDADLYGKGPQKMTDADVFTGEAQMDRMMQDSDIMPEKVDPTTQQLDAVIADDYNFDETERAAAAAAKKGDKNTVRKLLPKIPPHKTNKALLNILKGLI
jgi:hypothetical protein